MATEIEHKYLVRDSSYRESISKRLVITQGYITKDINRTVRIRIINNKAVITIKGKNNGDTRAEFEYEIPFNDALALINTLCIKPIIHKVRNIVEYHGNTWEIDEFEGVLAGLVIAEIEIPSSNYKYDIPPFIGKNVTDDSRYYNSNLVNAIKE